MQMKRKYFRVDFGTTKADFHPMPYIDENDDEKQIAAIRKLLLEGKSSCRGIFPVIKDDQSSDDSSDSNSDSIAHR